MKNITERFSDGKSYKTMKSIQLTGSEFLLNVHSTDGRVVMVVFRSDGETIIRADDSARLEHN